MAILVDTSVWIELLRRSGSPAIKKELAAMLKSRMVAYTCPVLFELTLGARPHEEAGVREALSNAERIEFQRSAWEGSAQLGQLLARRGISASAPDIQIAFVAMQQGLTLWTRDKHFALMQNIVGQGLKLRLFP